MIARALSVALAALFLLGMAVDARAQGQAPTRPPYRLDQLVPQPTRTFPCNPTGSTGVLQACTLASHFDFSGLQFLVKNVVGDTGAGGAAGLVPAPAPGDAGAGKVLGASGAWVTVAGGGGGGSLVLGDGTTTISAATTLNFNANDFKLGGGPAVASLSLRSKAFTKSTDYTFAAVDMGAILYLSGATARTLTVPAISSTIFPNESSSCYQNVGTAAWTLATGGGGPTINGTSSTKIPPGGGACLVSNGTSLNITGLQIATTTVLGGVMPDGTTTTVDANGVIHSAGGGGGALPTLSSGQLLGNATGSSATAAAVTLAMGSGLEVNSASGTMTVTQVQSTVDKRSSGQPIDGTDGNKFVLVGGFTYTIAAATGTLGSGFATVLQNAGATNATVTVSGASFIGLSASSTTSVPLAPGDQMVLVSSGGNYIAAISHSSEFPGQVKFSGTVLGQHSDVTGAANIDATYCGRTIHFNSASNATLTVQNTLPVDCNIAIDTLAAGLATVAAGSGATQATACTTARSRATNSVLWIHGRTNSGGTSATYSVSGDCG